MATSFDRKSLVSAAVGGAAAACVVVAYLWQRDAAEEKRAAAASRDMPQRFGAMDVGDARATSSRARSASQPEVEGPVTFPLSRSLYKRLEHDGYLVLRGMLPQETVAAARGVCEKIVDGLAAKLLAEGKIADLMEGEPFERRLAKLYEAHPEDAPTIFRQELRTQAMSHLFFNAPLLDLVARILDTPELRLAGDFAAYPKRPRSALPAAQQQVLYAGGKSLWHAARMNYDQLNVSEELMEASLEGTINVWTPLVSTTKANGCVRVVPGSHRLDVLCMLPRQDAHSHPSKGRGYLEVDEQLMAAHENKAVDVELEPGDIFLFKQNLIHSGRPNTTDGVRWSMDWRYQDARRQNLNLNPELSSLARSASNPQNAGWSKLD